MVLAELLSKLKRKEIMERVDKGISKVKRVPIKDSSLRELKELRREKRRLITIPKLRKQIAQEHFRRTPIGRFALGFSRAGQSFRQVGLGLRKRIRIRQALASRRGIKYKFESRAQAKLARMQILAQNPNANVRVYRNILIRKEDIPRFRVGGETPAFPSQPTPQPSVITNYRGEKIFVQPKQLSPSAPLKMPSPGEALKQEEAKARQMMRELYEFSKGAHKK